MRTEDPNRAGHEILVLDEIQDLLLQEHASVLSFVKKVLQKADLLIGSDIGSIGIIEEQNGTRWVVVRDTARSVVADESETKKKYVGRLKVGGWTLPCKERSFTGFVAYSRKPRRTGNVRQEKFYRATHEQTRSELATPVLLRGECLAVINLESMRPKYFTPRHERILKLVARMMAPTLDSLLTREGYRKPLTRALDQLNETLNSLSPGLSIVSVPTLNLVAGIIANVLNSRSCTIWLIDEDQNLILRGAFGPHLRAASGAHRDYVHKHRELGGGQTLAWKAIEQRCLLKFGPGYPRPRASGKYDQQVYGAKLSTPLLIAPLLAGSGAIGVLKVGLKKRTRDNPQGCYSGSDEEVLNVLQGQVAAAIERNLSELRRRDDNAHRRRSLSKLLTVLADHDVEKVLAKAVEGIAEVCNGLNCSIFLWNEARKRLVLAASKGLPSDQIGKASYELGEGLTGWVGQHGRPLILDVRSEKHLKRIDAGLKWKGKYSESTMSKDLGLRPFIAVPILRSGNTVGVIRVCDRAEGVFEESDEQVMTIVASHISNAIAYSDRYRDKVNLLDKLQKLMTVTREFSEIDKSIDDFERNVLAEAGRSAAEVLGTSILTIYRFDAEADVFHTPPIHIGKLTQPAFMNTPIHRDDLPWLVMEKGSRYWRQARHVKKLTERVQARDGLPERFRFVSREGIVSSAGIRLEVGLKKVGVMFLSFRKPQNFDLETRKIIEAFANQLALSLEIARLFRRAKDSASREEADYLAQDLHDGVLHRLHNMLSMAGTALDELRKTGRLDSDESLKCAGENMRSIEKVAQDCWNDCSDVVHLLKTPFVDDLGLKKALHLLVNESERPGVKLGLKMKFAQPSKNLQRHIYRVVQQALWNALDHAAATEILIAIQQKTDLLQVTIKDNGNGFDLTDKLTRVPSNQWEGTRRKRGYGLDGMKARVERAMAGKFTIVSSPGGGTKITAQIPIGGPPR